eukprot:1152374-Pelagomonas_calceolata.AAC.10
MERKGKRTNQPQTIRRDIFWFGSRITWVYIDNLQPESLADRLLVKHSQPPFTRLTINWVSHKEALWRVKKRLTKAAYGKGKACISVPAAKGAYNQTSPIWGTRATKRDLP